MNIENFTVGYETEGKITRIGMTHVTLEVEGIRGRMPIREINGVPVSRKMKPEKGDTMHVQVVGVERGKPVFGFRPW